MLSDSRKCNIVPSGYIIFISRHISRINSLFCYPRFRLPYPGHEYQFDNLTLQIHIDFLQQFVCQFFCVGRCADPIPLCCHGNCSFFLQTWITTSFPSFPFLIASLTLERLDLILKFLYDKLKFNFSNIRMHKNVFIQLCGSQSLGLRVHML